MIAYHSEPESPVVQIKVSGEVTDAEMKSAMIRLADDIAGGKDRILETIDHFTGIEPAAIWTDLKLGVPLANKVSRVAVVAEAGWIRAVTPLGGLFTRAEVRAFEPSQLAEARTWVEGRTALPQAVPPS
jgi:hypothetical protein